MVGGKAELFLRKSRTFFKGKSRIQIIDQENNFDHDFTSYDYYCKNVRVKSTTQNLMITRRI